MLKSSILKAYCLRLLWETILCFAQDCHPLGDHGFLGAAKRRILLAPSSENNQGLRLCAAKLRILLAQPCMVLKFFILTACLCKAQACTHSPVHLLCYPLALCIEKNFVFINTFLANISCHKTLRLVFLFGVTSPLHACAKHKILILWVLMQGQSP